MMANYSGRIMMKAGSYYAPKINLSKPFGEDAHFIYSDAQTIGVADGVGGWAVQGVDSGIYARQLMMNVVRSICAHAGPPVDPKKALEEALLNTKEKGSSTACILTVNDIHLHAVNVGDSGFLHFRNGEVIYRSPIQQQAFNCPFQLSALSSTDLSSVMEILRYLEPGDIIIAGTDGLFDNVHEVEIQKLVIEGVEVFNMGMTKMARKIGIYAIEKALDSTAYTPFAHESWKAGNRKAIGGKYDDITVVVAYIVPAEFEYFFPTMDVFPGVL